MFLFKPQVLWLGMDDCRFTWEQEKRCANTYNKRV